MKDYIVPAALVLILSGVSSSIADEPIEIGSRRQLFVDRYLIDTMTDVRLVLHRPVRREVVIRGDRPWDAHGVSYMVTFRDGDRLRAWYRGDAASLAGSAARSSRTAYSESHDGINWTKPELGIIDFRGSKQNNLVWDGPAGNLAVFKDGNPDCPDDERYKAVGRSADLYGLVSPDGLHWRLVSKTPILTDRPFDSHNIAFWDSWQGQYVAYTRGVRREGQPGAAMRKNFRGGVRDIRRSVSKDFRNWSPPQLIDLANAPLEHLYTNATVPYQRAEGLYLMFPSRYADARKPDPLWKFEGVNDIVFLSSRDGVRFDRTFMEAFVRPGLDQANWHDRSLYMERGILETSPTEISMYAMENWRMENVHIRRLTLRPDGFASVQAGYHSGQVVTRPIRFTGRNLRLNYSTSAVGSIRVEILDAQDRPIPGFTLDNCPELFGDQIDQIIQWKSSENLEPIAAKRVKLRFVMRDADLYAFRFEN
jgi:hypothetical protein